MADPFTAIGLAASIVQLIEATTKVYKYLNEIKHATKERAELAMEAANLVPLLTSLRNRVEKAYDNSEETWIKNTIGLGGPDGPLEKFKGVMLKLQSKLNPVRGMKGVDEVKDFFAQIERFKTLVQLALQDDLMTLSKAIKDDTAEITSLRRRVTGLVQSSEKRATDEDIQAISAWLSPIEFIDRHNEVRTSRAKATGRWFLESDKFKAWLEKRPSILFCVGIPGAGKTIIASTVVDFLLATFDKEQEHMEESDDDQQDTAVLYIYCNYKERLMQTPINMIAGLLSQLIRYQRLIPEPLRRHYDRFQKRGVRPSLNDLSVVLQDQLKFCSRAFIVVDALDEYSDQDAARETIINVLRKLQENANLMVTSRSLPSIIEKFATATQMEIRAQEVDLRIYLENEVNWLAPCVKKKTELKELVIDSIVEAVDGMFLLAQLYAKSLIDKLRPRDVKDALGKLPKGSGSTASDFAYDEAMRRIQSQEEGFRNLAEQILSWIVWAVRPLTVPELQHALSIEPGDDELDEDNFLDANDLTSVCAGLVIIDQERQLIRLVHYTTQEYFERRRDELFGGIQNKIAATCITYLCLEIFNDPCPDLEVLLNRVTEYPLLAYAAPYWGHHVRATSELIQRDYIMRLLTEHSRLISAIQIKHYLEGNPVDHEIFSDDSVHAISTASESGLEETVSELLRKEPNKQISENRDTWGRTLLCAAIIGGREAMVRAMLQRGADVNIVAYDRDGTPPLCVAARGENSNIVKLLLEEGADPSSADENGRTCLHYSVMIESVENTRLLVVAGAQLEARNLYDETPLLTAVWHITSNSRDIVKLLLEHGANADARFTTGESCIHKAVAQSDTLKLRILLERGANVEARDSKGDSVLHYAAARLMDENGDILTSLLAKHKDQGTLQNALEARNNNGCTALHVAASTANKSNVEILVRSGASLEAKDEDGDTPLHAAIKAVRDHCQDMNFDIKGGIMEAVSTSDVCQSIVTLLDAGADPLAMNDLEITPMAVAVGAPHFEALQGMKLWHAEQKALLLELDQARWSSQNDAFFSDC